MLTIYSDLGRIKKENKALHFSSQIEFKLPAVEDENIFVIERTLEDQQIIFIGNLSNKSKEITPIMKGAYKNLFSNQILHFDSKQKIEFKAWDYLLLEKL